MISASIKDEATGNEEPPKEGEDQAEDLQDKILRNIEDHIEDLKKEDVSTNVSEASEKENATKETTKRIRTFQTSTEDPVYRADDADRVDVRGDIQTEPADIP